MSDPTENEAPEPERPEDEAPEPEPLPKSITPWKFGSVPIKKGANIEAMGMYLLLLDEHRKIIEFPHRGVLTDIT